MKLYGLRGFTHGGQKTLTVMSPDGAKAALKAIRADDGVITEAEPGRLTIYFERLAGTIDRLISLNNIEVLDKPGWDAKKAEIGDSTGR
ncbi:MAG: hypothetical protein EXQ94_10945 [Alphaproteobacteria bacterium]|nr:hypothetical protein [Alphaproteobacteria bacterium]